MVGWKFSLSHRAPLVNWPPPRPSGPSFFPLPGSPYVLPVSKCPAQQIFETLQVNHTTKKLPPPPLQTQRGREPLSQHDRLLSEQATVTPERLLLMINNLPTHKSEIEKERERETLSYSPQEPSSQLDWHVAPASSPLDYLDFIKQHTEAGYFKKLDHFSFLLA